MVSPLILLLLLGVPLEPELVIPEYMTPDALALSPDGTLLAAKEATGIALWETGTGRQLRVIRSDATSGSHLAMSGDGKRLATSGTGKLLVYELPGGKELARIEYGGYGSPPYIAFSKDGSTIVAGYTDMVRLIDVRGAKVLREVPLKPAVVRWAGFTDGSSDPLVIVRDNPAGTHRALRVVKAGVPKPTGAALGVLASFVVSRDGKRIYGQGSGALGGRLFGWELATGKEIAKSDALPDVQELAIAADGKSLVVRHAQPAAIGHDAPRSSGLSWWDPSGAKLVPIGAAGAADGKAGAPRILALLIGRDGTLYAGTSGGVMRFTRAAGGAYAEGPPLRTPERSYPELLALESDALLLGPGSKGQPLMRLLRQSGELVAMPVKPESGPYRLTPDGKWLGATSADVKSIDVFEIATGKRTARLTPGHQRFGDFELSADGRRAAALAADSSSSGSGKYAKRSSSYALGVFDIPSGSRLHEIPFGEHKPSFALAPDGRLLVTAVQNTATVWDVSGGAPAKARTLEDARGMRHITFGRDPVLLASANETEVKLWNAGDGSVRHTLPHPEGKIGFVRFSADGAHLVTGSANGTLHVWEVATGKDALSFTTGAAYTLSGLLSPDAMTFASTSGGDVSFLGADGKALGDLFFFATGWVAVARDGSVDGTPEALQQLHWRVGDQTKPIDAFLAAKQKKGLLAALR